MGPYEILLVYWAESAVVGIYNAFRMALAKGHILTKLFFIPFFWFHYGMFTMGHLFFISFLMGKMILPFPIASLTDVFSDIIGLMSLTEIGISFAILMASHGYSFFANYVGKKEYGSTNVMELFTRPYRRIVVMHLTIIIGSFFFIFLPAALGFILIFVKLYFDVKLHLNEHKKYENK